MSVEQVNENERLVLRLLKEAEISIGQARRTAVTITDDGSAKPTDSGESYELTFGADVLTWSIVPQPNPCVEIGIVTRVGEQGSIGIKIRMKADGWVLCYQNRRDAHVHSESPEAKATHELACRIRSSACNINTPLPDIIAEEQICLQNAEGLERAIRTLLAHIAEAD